MDPATLDYGLFRYASLDKRVLPFKPGVLMPPALCEEVMQRFEAGVPRIRALTAELA